MRLLIFVVSAILSLILPLLPTHDPCSVQRQQLFRSNNKGLLSTPESSKTINLCSHMGGK